MGIAGQRSWLAAVLRSDEGSDTESSKDMDSAGDMANLQPEGSTRPTADNTTSNANDVNPSVDHGAGDPENEGNIHPGDASAAERLRTAARDHSTRLETNPDGEEGLLRTDNGSDPDLASGDNINGPQKERNIMPPPGELHPAHRATSSVNGILQLPSELIGAIFGYLSPLDLARVTQVCKALHSLADADFFWQREVLSKLPGNPIKTPYPFETFRELYICHDPYWFIPKHKIWFCDRGLTGQLIVVQYDERRGVIEGYQLVAVRDPDSSGPSSAWLADHEVEIHHFRPNVKLHRDKPVVKFSPFSLEKLVRTVASSSASSIKGKSFVEQPMPMNRDSDPQFSNIILAKPLSDSLVEATISKEFPYDHVWPPPAIPARHRVAAQASGISPFSSLASTRESPSLWKPIGRAETSDQTFRVRQWLEIGTTLGVHIGEKVVTYSTLDPVYYTPTAEKPWRGIWVGDYSAHGCEFVLIHQPDLEDEESKKPFVRNEGESDAEFEERFLRERVHKGAIEAIKLTGDPNVPRGEHTFIAEDIGEAGFIGHARVSPFDDANVDGTRVVKSCGHIANEGFQRDKYIESQLLLISHNRLAQYWVGFGHISFFERVDIDRFLVP